MSGAGMRPQPEHLTTYLKTTNDDPKPFAWTATADQILDKVRRGRVALDAITN